MAATAQPGASRARPGLVSGVRRFLAGRHAAKASCSLHILRESRSVLEFLDADYTFVNARLAKHYGLPAPPGENFHRISLLESRRRGSAHAWQRAHAHVAADSDLAG
jgi:hypothetical protein